MADFGQMNRNKMSQFDSEVRDNVKINSFPLRREGEKQEKLSSLLQAWSSFGEAKQQLENLEERANGAILIERSPKRQKKPKKSLKGAAAPLQTRKNKAKYKQLFDTRTGRVENPVTVTQIEDEDVVEGEVLNSVSSLNDTFTVTSESSVEKPDVSLNLPKSPKGRVKSDGFSKGLTRDSIGISGFGSWQGNTSAIFGPSVRFGSQKGEGDVKLNAKGNAVPFPKPIPKESMAEIAPSVVRTTGPLREFNLPEVVPTITMATDYQPTLDSLQQRVKRQQKAVKETAEVVSQLLQQPSIDLNEMDYSSRNSGVDLQGSYSPPQRMTRKVCHSPIKRGPARSGETPLDSAKAGVDYNYMYSHAYVPGSVHYSEKHRPAVPVREGYHGDVTRKRKIKAVPPPQSVLDVNRKQLLAASNKKTLGPQAHQPSYGPFKPSVRAAKSVVRKVAVRKSSTPSAEHLHGVPMEVKKQKLGPDITPSSWRRGKEIQEKVINVLKREKETRRQENDDERTSSSLLSSLASSPSSRPHKPHSPKSGPEVVDRNSFLTQNAAEILADLEAESDDEPAKKEANEGGNRTATSKPAKKAKILHPPDDQYEVPRVRHYNQHEIRKYVQKQKEDRKRRQQEEKEATQLTKKQKDQRLKDLYKVQRSRLSANLANVYAKQRYTELTFSKPDSQGLHCFITPGITSRNTELPSEPPQLREYQQGVTDYSPSHRNKSLLSEPSSSLMEDLSTSREMQQALSPLIARQSPSPHHTPGVRSPQKSPFKSESGSQPGHGQTSTFSSLLNPLPPVGGIIYKTREDRLKALTLSAMALRTRVQLEKERLLHATEPEVPPHKKQNQGHTKPPKGFSSPLHQKEMLSASTSLPGVGNLDEHLLSVHKDGRRNEAAAKIQAAYKGHRVREYLRKVGLLPHQPRRPLRTSNREGQVTPGEFVHQVWTKAEEVVSSQVPEGGQTWKKNKTLELDGSTGGGSRGAGWDPWDRAGGDTYSMVNVYVKKHLKQQRQQAVEKTPQPPTSDPLWQPYDPSSSLSFTEEGRKDTPEDLPSSTPSSNLVQPGLTREPCPEPMLDQPNKVEPSLLVESVKELQTKELSISECSTTPCSSVSDDPTDASLHDKVTEEERRCEPDSLDSLEPSLSVQTDEETVSGSQDTKEEEDEEEGRLSPRSLQLKLTAELMRLETAQDQLQHLTDMERYRAVTLVQNSTTDIAQTLKGKQEDELKALSEKAQEDLKEVKQQLMSVKGEAELAAQKVCHLEKETATKSVQHAQLMAKLEQEAKESQQQLAEARRVASAAVIEAARKQMENAHNLATQTAISAAKAAVEAALVSKQTLQDSSPMETTGTETLQEDVSQSVSEASSSDQMEEGSTGTDQSSIPTGSVAEEEERTLTGSESEGDSDSDEGNLDDTLVAEEEECPSPQATTATRSLVITEEISQTERRSAEVPSEGGFEESESHQPDEVSFRMILPSESHRRRQRSQEKTAIHPLKLSFSSHPDLMSSMSSLHDDVSVSEASHLSPAGVGSGEVSFDNFTLNMITQLVNDQEIRAKHQSTLLKLREKALHEQTKAKLKVLDQWKKLIQKKGADDKMPAILQKEKGLLRKYQNEKAELRNLQKVQRKEREEIKHLMLQQKDIGKMRLSAQSYRNKARKLEEDDQISLSVSSLSPVSQISDTSLPWKMPTSTSTPFGGRQTKSSESSVTEESQPPDSPSGTQPTYKTDSQSVSEKLEEGTSLHPTSFIEEAFTVTEVQPLSVVLEHENKESEILEPKINSSSASAVATTPSDETFTRRIQSIQEKMVAERELSRREQKLARHHRAALEALEVEQKLLEKETKIKQAEEEISRLLDQADVLKKKRLQLSQQSAGSTSLQEKEDDTVIQTHSNPSLISAEPQVLHTTKSEPAVTEEVGSTSTVTEDEGSVRTEISEEIRGGPNREEDYAQETFESISSARGILTSTPFGASVIQTQRSKGGVAFVKSDSPKTDTTEMTTMSSTVTDSSEIELRIRRLKEDLRQRKDEIKQVRQEQKRKKRTLLQEREDQLKRKLMALEEKLEGAKQSISRTNVSIHSGTTSASEAEEVLGGDQRSPIIVKPQDTSHSYTPFTDNGPQAEDSKSEETLKHVQTVLSVQEEDETLLAVEDPVQKDHSVSPVSIVDSKLKNPSISSTSSVTEAISPATTSKSLPTMSSSPSRSSSKGPSRIPVRASSSTSRTLSPSRKSITPSKGGTLKDLSYSSKFTEVKTTSSIKEDINKEEDTLQDVSSAESVEDVVATKVSLTTVENETVTAQNDAQPAKPLEEPLLKEEALNDTPLEPEEGTPEPPQATDVTSQLAEGFRLGQKVVVGNAVPGVVRYIGQVHFSPGTFLGIELDEANGTNNGTLKGRTYFECPEEHGIFAPPSKVSLLEDDWQSSGDSGSEYRGSPFEEQVSISLDSTSQKVKEPEEVESEEESVTPSEISSIELEEVLPESIDREEPEDLKEKNLEYEQNRQDRRQRQVDAITDHIMNGLVKEMVKDIGSIRKRDGVAVKRESKHQRIGEGVTNDLMSMLLQSEISLVLNIRNTKRLAQEEARKMAVRTPPETKTDQARPTVLPVSNTILEPPKREFQKPSPSPISPPPSPPGSPPKWPGRALAAERSPPHTPHLDTTHAHHVTGKVRHNSERSTKESLIAEHSFTDTELSFLPRDKASVDKVTEVAWNDFHNSLESGSVPSTAPPDVLKIKPPKKTAAHLVSKEEKKCRDAFLQLIYQLAIEEIQEAFMTPQQKVATNQLAGLVMRRKSSVAAEPPTLESVKQQVFFKLIEGRLPVRLPKARFHHGMRRPGGKDVDFLEAVLIRELRADERKWTEFDSEEFEIKMRTADAILNSLLDETTKVFQLAQERKKLADA